jgi:hypothetical protein
MPPTHRLGATHCALLVHASHAPAEHTLLQHCEFTAQASPTALQQVPLVQSVAQHSPA